MFPAATAVTVARNIARRGVFSHFCPVKSRYVFSRSVKVCRDRGSPKHYGRSRMVLRSIPACHVLLGPLTFVTLRSSSAMSIKLCQGTWAMNGV